MIKILGNQIDSKIISEQHAEGSVENKILNILFSSPKIYNYDSLEQLRFEIKLRASIVNAAKELDKSKFSFRTFRKSKCNTEYWYRTNEGGFLLHRGVKPSLAIKDIYISGEKYGTECATAIVIIYYKALLDVFQEEIFNKIFPTIYLMNWQHLDKNIGIKDYTNDIEYLPGDCLYFKNPDVNPLTPEWQGENVIAIGDGTYFGHGIGIGTAEQIINALNKHRKKESKTPAYLLEKAMHPNFNYLASIYHSFIT